MQNMTPMQVINGLVVAALLFAIGTGLMHSAILEKITAHLIGPFDPRPEITFSEIITHPEK
jgi:hypothetical protein